MSRLLSKNDPRDAISKSVIGNFVLDTVARAIDKPEQQLEAMTRKWQSREISNVGKLSQRLLLRLIVSLHTCNCLISMLIEHRMVRYLWFRVSSADQ